MKNVVRALTLALAVTGIAAAIQPAPSTARILTGHLNFVPVPTCHPNDPNACGLK